MNQQYSFNRPRIHDGGPVHTNPFYYVSHMVAEFDGFTKDYFVSEHGQRVGLVVLRNDCVLLVRQYRFLIDGLSWEIPGGGVKAGENVEAGAIRECVEETGVACRNLRSLVSFHQGLDAVHNPTSVFYTSEFTDTGADNGDIREVVEHLWVPMDQCVDMIFSGHIADSFSIASLLSYRTLIRESR